MKHALTAVTLIAAVSAAPALAAQWTFADVDQDANLELAEGEFETVSRDLFEALDADADELVDEEEVRAFDAEAAAGWTEWDVDDDAALNWAEFHAGLFAAYDADRNDALAEGEFVALAQAAPGPAGQEQATARGDAGEDQSGLRNQHADLTAAIDSSNVGELAQLWSFEAPTPISHVPLIDNGRVYFADWGGTAYALDANSGEVVWKKQIEQPMTKWPWHGFAGTGTLGEGMLFEASVEGNLFALDAETGEVKWQTRIAEDQHAGSISKLTYYDGKVFVGLQSVEEPLTAKMDINPDFRGKVLAIDAATGDLIWERPLVEEPHNGVAVWSSFAIDPDAGRLFFTTGNNYTGEATELSDSIVAVDIATGEIVWSDQATPQDVWTMADQRGPDYDFAGGPQLFEASIDGEQRELVGAGQKSGFFHVWDRDTGERVWSASIGYGGIDGGMHGEASIGDGKILAWSNNSYVHTADPSKHPLSVKALDAATGNYLWVKNHAHPAWIHSAGFLANDVYFVGSLNGTLYAYNAENGEQIWKASTPGPITASVWAQDGMVLVPTGAPGLFGEWAKGGKNTVTAFGLSEAAATAAGESRERQGAPVPRDGAAERRQQPQQ